MHATSEYLASGIGALTVAWSDCFRLCFVETLGESTLPVSICVMLNPVLKRVLVLLYWRFVAWRDWLILLLVWKSQIA